MSNSKLISYTLISPNKTSPRNQSIDRITPHCVVGQLSAESICGCFKDSSRQASCNYGIGTDGRIALCVDESDRSWCSSNKANDHRAVTIECASDSTDPYAFNDAVYASLIELCVDICQRNGKTKLLWLGDKDTTLNYTPASNEMVLTVHRWFANKSCPGDWMYARMGNLATQVTAKLGSITSSSSTKQTSSTYPTVPFTVQVIVSDLNYRSEPSMSGTVKGQTGKGTFTITEVSGNWGKLKSGAGWIYLGNSSYCTILSSSSSSATSTKTTSEEFLVEVTTTTLNIRTGPGTNYSKTGKYTGRGTFTITEVKSGTGSTAGWGKLKSGAGWISLDYATRK